MPIEVQTEDLENHELQVREREQLAVERMDRAIEDLQPALDRQRVRRARWARQEPLMELLERINSENLGKIMFFPSYLWLRLSCDVSGSGNETGDPVCRDLLNWNIQFIVLWVCISKMVHTQILSVAADRFIGAIIPHNDRGSLPQSSLLSISSRLLLGSSHAGHLILALSILPREGNPVPTILAILELNVSRRLLNMLSRLEDHFQDMLSLVDFGPEDVEGVLGKNARSICCSLCSYPNATRLSVAIHFISAVLAMGLECSDPYFDLTLIISATFMLISLGVTVFYSLPRAQEPKVPRDDEDEEREVELGLRGLEHLPLLAGGRADV